MAQGMAAKAFCICQKKYLELWVFLRKRSDKDPWSFFFALCSSFLSSFDATQAVCQLSNKMAFLEQADQSKFGANRKHDLGNRRLRFN